METTLQTKTGKLELILIVSIVVMLLFSYVFSAPRSFSFSKIEGNIVVRDDSVKTVLIPDLR